MLGYTYKTCNINYINSQSPKTVSLQKHVQISWVLDFYGILLSLYKGLDISSVTTPLANQPLQVGSQCLNVINRGYYMQQDTFQIWGIVILYNTF